MLVVDEFCHLSCDSDAANILLLVLLQGDNPRHLPERSLPLTVNKPLSDSADVPHDYDLADSILNRDHMVSPAGPSRRTPRY